MNSQLRWLVIVLLIAHFALALQYSLHNPLGEAPDEADHWAYVVHLAQTGTLPVGPAMTQGKHPPLYHATAALFAALGDARRDFFQPNPAVTLEPAPGWSPGFFKHGADEQRPWRGGVLAMHLARLVSVWLSVVTVASALALGRAVAPDEPWLAVATAGVLAFIPEFLFIGASINNDTAAALFGVLALWGGLAIYRGKGRFASGWWTPLALGAGLLSKVHTVAIWPVVALAIVAGAISAEQAQAADGQQSVQPGRWSRALITAGLVFLPGLLIAAPWLLRNWLLYGDPLAVEMAMQTIDVRTSAWRWTDSSWLLRGWFVSFWGKFGGAGHIPMPGPIYGVLALLTGVSAAGLVQLWRKLRGKDERTAWALIGLAPLTTAIAMWRYSLVALGTDQGRLLYPALAPLALLFVGGLYAWVPSRVRPILAIVLVLAFACLGLYGLWGVILPALQGG